MQRDMDLIRQILFKLEAHVGGFAPETISVDGYTSEQIGYHIWLLGQSGMMTTVEMTVHGDHSPQASAISLTWDGHDFIDAARSDTRWSKAMEMAKKIGGPLSIAVLKPLLESLWKAQLGV